MGPDDTLISIAEKVYRNPERWKEIYNALNEIGYRGSATVELPGGDLPYLTEVSRRVDLIFTGA